MSKKVINDSCYKSNSTYFEILSLQRLEFFAIRIRHRYSLFFISSRKLWARTLPTHETNIKENQFLFFPSEGLILNWWRRFSGNIVEPINLADCDSY